MSNGGIGSKQQSFTLTEKFRPPGAELLAEIKSRPRGSKRNERSLNALEMSVAGSSIQVVHETQQSLAQSNVAAALEQVFQPQVSEQDDQSEDQQSDLISQSDRSDNDQNDGSNLLDRWYGVDDDDNFPTRADLQKTGSQKAQELLSFHEIIEQMVQQKVKHQKDLSQQLDHKTTKIFKQNGIKEMAVGTFKMDLTDQNQKKQSTKIFMPFFPHQYLEQGSPEQNIHSLQNFDLQGVSLQLFNKDFNKDRIQCDGEQQLPTTIQLKFSYFPKKLLSNSREHRLMNQENDNTTFNDVTFPTEKRTIQMCINIAKYKANINHCPKILYARETDLQNNPIDGGDLTMVIELNTPAEFYEEAFCEKTKRTKYFRITCPFKMSNDSVLFGESEVQNNSGGDLLNYWNLKQVIYVKGSQDAAFDAEQVFEKLIEQERISCFDNLDGEVGENFDFSIMVSLGNEEQDKFTKRVVKELSKISQQAYEFDELIKNLAMPLRLSLMVPISSRKLQIFDREIIELIKYFVKTRNYTFERHAELIIEQEEKFWNSDHPEQFDFKLQQIVLEAFPGIYPERILNFGELQTILDDMLSSTDSTGKNKFKDEAKNQSYDANRICQRRVFLTPSLTIVRPMEVEQSNGFIREVKTAMEYFVRINILDDDLREIWFNETSRSLLSKFVQPSVNTIKFCDIDLQFLNYSASQIKQKSWWMFVYNHGIDHQVSQAQTQTTHKPQETKVQPTVENLFEAQIQPNQEGGSQIQGGESGPQGSSLIPDDEQIQEQRPSIQQNTETETTNLQDTTDHGSFKALKILSKKSRDAWLDGIGKFFEKKPLKKLARQGQPFSSSTYIRKMNKGQFKTIEDASESGYEFTDGCGYISNEIMGSGIDNPDHSQVCNIFEVTRASAIQMRYRGFKGVLVEHKGLQNTGTQALFRNSMEKFPGDLDELGVIRISTYSPAYLNRQVILVLDYLGVPKQEFIDRNKKAIQNLDVSKVIKNLHTKLNEVRQKNKELLEQEGKEQTEDEEMKSIIRDANIFFGPSKQFKKIFIRALLQSANYTAKSEQHQDMKVQFKIDNEPIFKQILYNMALGQGQQLKKRQRIRMHDAAVLIGVCDIQGKIRLSTKNDETKGVQSKPQELNLGEEYSAMLGEGEVFCQIEPFSFANATKQESRNLKHGLKKSVHVKNSKKLEDITNLIGATGDNPIQLITGDVLITKNPCGHKGDIRQAKAIGRDHPAYQKLKHLVNVIVFPVVGERPLQNCMSGGDLDGDVYMIIWDKRLVGYVQQEFKDKPFPQPSGTDEEKLKEECTEDLAQTTFDVGKTICGYFERDTLGKMSNLHLRLAIEHGLDCKDPVMKEAVNRAAFLCSVQVDFAKHGRCVKVEQYNQLLKYSSGCPGFLIDEERDGNPSKKIGSDHVIQTLYDQVNLKDLYEDCIQSEHQNSILLRYSLTKYFIKIESTQEILKHSCHFEKIHSEYIWNMERDLKNLMIKHKLVNEGELFCSDFRYRFSDEKSREYMGVGRSNEDTVNDIQRELDRIIKKYRDGERDKNGDIIFPGFRKRCEDLFNAQASNLNETFVSQQTSDNEKKEKPLKDFQKEMSKALYFLAYLDDGNEQSQDFRARLDQDVDGVTPQQKRDFEGIWETKIKAKQEWHEDLFGTRNKVNFQQDIINVQNEFRLPSSGFNSYKKFCRMAEEGNEDKIKYIWAIKKMFTVPWLIAYDYLLVSQPISK